MIPTKTYPLSAIMGGEISDKERIAELADAFNRVCAENADFVAESIKADRRVAELEAEVKEYAAILRQSTEGTDALVESHYADDGSGFIGEFVPAEVCRIYERLWKTSVAQTREESK
jgi:hypothetical protein